MIGELNQMERIGSAETTAPSFVSKIAPIKMAIKGALHMNLKKCRISELS